MFFLIKKKVLLGEKEIKRENTKKKKKKKKEKGKRMQVNYQKVQNSHMSFSIKITKFFFFNKYYVNKVLKITGYSSYMSKLLKFSMHFFFYKIIIEREKSQKGKTHIPLLLVKMENCNISRKNKKAFL